ncbi:hypothetical protein EAI_06415 [Harpegnathos saltator]|uniref:Uncharacterized protein n=1 Tax=Harpegnathos saltator TaxID=610380 RepID=E2BM01_HARSA|nr:hypothetical protein EAI_06415 [Harpegnathos saltator]
MAGDGEKEKKGETKAEKERKINEELFGRIIDDTCAEVGKSLLGQSKGPGQDTVHRPFGPELPDEPGVDDEDRFCGPSVLGKRGKRTDTTSRRDVTEKASPTESCTPRRGSCPGHVADPSACERPQREHRIF